MTRLLCLVLMICSTSISSMLTSAPAGDNAMSKSKTSTTVYTLKNAKFYGDTAQWKPLQDSLPNPSIDFQFEHVDGNMRGMLLSFKEFVPMDEFIESFIGGMKEDAPETKIVERRNVKVNGVPMVEITIDMPTPQAPIRYFGYVYSGTKGVCMALGICHRDLFAEVKTTLETFAAGLVVASAAGTAPKTK
ncbi:MAG: hypothetical protein NTX15_11240 [Candidatus Kapabacteria bacterium]|nr:hypothetical protein [Candidatus Kapabacteria bacterium]